MSDTQHDDDLTPLLRRYNEPPAFPHDTLSQALFDADAGARVPWRRRRLRIPASAAFAAGLATFVAGAAAGWLLERGIGDDGSAVVETRLPPSGDDIQSADVHRVVWF